VRTSDLNNVHPLTKEEEKNNNNKPAECESGWNYVKKQEEDIHNDYRPMFLFGFRSWLHTQNSEHCRSM